MLTVKDAAAAAEQYVRGLYPAAEIPFLRLEEIELSADKKVWHVTLSWVEQAVSTLNPLSALGQAYSIEKRPRVYKSFKVDAESREVLSMKLHPAS